MLRSTLRAAVCIAICWLAAAYTVSANTVAFVADFKGKSTGYSIERGGRQVPVAYFRALFPGDIIHVLSLDGQIVLNFAGGGRVIVSRKAAPFAPFTVPPRPQQWPQSLRNLSETIGAAITRDKDRDGPTLTTRDTGNLSFTNPGLDVGAAQVAEGARLLAFAWGGGVPPYRVVVRTTDGRVLLDEGAIRSFQIILASRPVVLKPGRHSVTLFDAAGEMLHGHFTVREASFMPVPQDANSLLALDEQSRRLLIAAWLSSKDRQSFGYEAYLQLIPLLLADPPNEGAVALSETLGAP